MQAASDWLDKADKAYRDKEDEKKVDQLAHLTNQRVEVAKDTIALRESEAKLKNAGDERARALLDARDAQIKQLQDSLNAKQTDRGTLVTFGDVLFATNKAHLKSSGLVNINKLARRMGKKRIIAETGAGMHGVATATVAALKCLFIAALTCSTVRAWDCFMKSSR